MSSTGSDPRRILVLSDEYPPAGGGLGATARQFVHDLARSGHDLTLVTGDEANSEEPLVARHVLVPRTTLIWPLSYRRRLRRLDLESYDLVLLNDVTAVWVAGHLFPRSVLERSLILVHGADARFVFRQGGLRARLFRYPGVYGRALHHARRVVCNSRWCRDRFLESVPQPFDPARVEVAYAGLSSREMSGGEGVTRASLGVPEGAVMLFSASRLVPEKGYPEMLAHFERAVAAGRDWYWVVAGGGPYEAALRERAARPELGGRLIVAGRVPRDELPGYYRTADLFWLLSKASYETFGLVFLEAAWCGTPSLARRLNGVVESIDEGRTGFFLEDEDLEGLVDRALRDLKPEDCVAFARDFDCENYSRRLVELAAATGKAPAAR